MTQAAKLDKRLAALQSTTQQLSDMQPSLHPCLELIPCVAEAGTVGQLLRANHRKIKALQGGYKQLKDNYETIEAEVTLLSNPEEEDKPLKYMLQKTAYRLNKSDLRSKRSEKRLRHLKQRLLSYARNDLSNVQSSYLHELSSLQSYFQRQCNSFQNMIPKPLEIKPFFTEIWSSIHSDEVSSLVTTGKDWIADELSLIVSAAFVELNNEFEHHIRNFVTTADYELEELHRELRQLQQLATLKAPSHNAILTPEQVTDFAQYSDYLTSTVEVLTKATSELEIRTQSAVQPQLDELELSDAEVLALRRHLDELQETVQVLEDQSNQYFDEQEELENAPVASRINSNIMQLNQKIQNLQMKLSHARPGRQSLEIQVKQVDQLYVVSLEDFPQKTPLVPSGSPLAPADYEDQ